MRLAAGGGVASVPRAVHGEKFGGERAKGTTALAENMLNETPIPGFDHAEIAGIVRAVLTTVMD